MHRALCLAALVFACTAGPAPARKLPKVEPLSIEALHRQALALEVTGELEALPEIEKALAEVDRRLERKQESVLLRIRRARLLGLLGKPVEALVDLNWVLQRRPNNPDARQSRGTVLFALGEHRRARADFLEALASAPERLYLRRYVRMCNEAECLQCPCNRPRMRCVPACVH